MDIFQTAKFEIPDLIGNGCKATRNHRWILFQLDPHCFWCGCLVEWKTPREFYDNAATIDHLGGHRKRVKQNVVLACNACNQMRCWIVVKYRATRPKRISTRQPWTSKQEKRLQEALNQFTIRQLLNRRRNEKSLLES